MGQGTGIEVVDRGGGWKKEGKSFDEIGFIVFCILQFQMRENIGYSWLGYYYSQLGDYQFENFKIFILVLVLLLVGV